MKVIVKKEHSNNNKMLSLKKRVSAKKELKSTAIEFEDRQAAPGNKALKGVLPFKRVSTPAGGENQPNSVQRGVSEVERKGKIDDETLDLNVGRGGTADTNDGRDKTDSKDADYSNVNNDDERERYLKILAALSSRNATRRNSSSFPPLMEGTLTATKIVKPGDIAHEAEEKKGCISITADQKALERERVCAESDAIDAKDAKETAGEDGEDTQQQLLQPSVASSEGSVPDEDEGVFTQPSVTVQEQSTGPASLIFIAGNLSQRSQRKADTKVHLAVQPSSFTAPLMGTPIMSHQHQHPRAMLVATSMTPVKEESEAEEAEGPYEGRASPIIDDLPSPEPHHPSAKEDGQDEVEMNRNSERERQQRSTPTFSQNGQLGEIELGLEGSPKPLSPNPLEREERAGTPPSNKKETESPLLSATIPAPGNLVEMPSSVADAMLEPDLDSLLCISQELTEIQPDLGPPEEPKRSNSPITVSIVSCKSPEASKEVAQWLQRPQGPAGTSQSSPPQAGSPSPASSSRPSATIALAKESLVCKPGESIDFKGNMAIAGSSNKAEADALELTMDDSLGLAYMESLESGISVDRGTPDEVPFAMKSLGNPYQPPPTSPITATDQYTASAPQLMGNGQKGYGRMLVSREKMLGDNQSKINDELATPKRQNRLRKHYHDRDHRIEVAVEERQRFERQRHNEAVERASKVSTRLHEVARIEPVAPSAIATDNAETWATEIDLSGLTEQMQRYKGLRKLHRGYINSDMSIVDKEVQRLERIKTMKREEEVVTTKLAARFQRGWLQDAYQAAWQDNDSKVHDGLSLAYEGSTKDEDEDEIVALSRSNPSQSEAPNDDPFKPLYDSSEETYAGSLATISVIERTKTTSNAMIIPNEQSGEILQVGQSVEFFKQPSGEGALGNALTVDGIEDGPVTPSHKSAPQMLQPGEGLKEGSTISLLDATGRKTNKKGSTKLRMLPQFKGRKLGQKGGGEVRGKQNAQKARESIPDRDYQPEQSIMKPVVWAYDPKSGDHGVQEDTLGPLVVEDVAFARSTVSRSHIIAEHAGNLAEYVCHAPARPPDMIAVGGKALSRASTEVTEGEPKPLGYSAISKFSSKHSRV